MKRKISAERIFILITTAILSFTLSCSEPDPAETYALVYGLADYLYISDLNLTDDDAEAVADLLEAKGWDVTLRLSSEATLAQIEADISELSAVMDDNDRLLFYYSGHGVSYNDNYWIFPYDGNTADLYSTSINTSILKAMIESSGAGLMTVILDSCNSGGFVDSNITVDTVADNYFKSYSSGISAVNESFSLYLSVSDADQKYTVLSAAGAGEESYETSTIGHGVFTYFLLQTPSYADYNRDGYITLTEAFYYTAYYIDTYWNDDEYEGENDLDYYPHVSAFPVDPLLFEAD